MLIDVSHPGTLGVIPDVSDRVEDGASDDWVMVHYPVPPTLRISHKLMRHLVREIVGVWIDE